MTKRQKQSTISHAMKRSRNNRYVRKACQHTSEVALPYSKMEISGACMLVQSKQPQLCSHSQGFGVHLNLQTAPSKSHQHRDTCTFFSLCQEECLGTDW